MNSLKRVFQKLHNMFSGIREIGQSVAIYAIILAVIAVVSAGVISATDAGVNDYLDDGSARIIETNIGSDETFIEMADSRDMVVYASDYEGVYDGYQHSGVVLVNRPLSGAVVTFGSTEGSYTSLIAPTYINVGNNTVYFKVTAPGYNDYYGSYRVVITQRVLQIPTLQTASFEFNGSQQYVTFDNYEARYCTIGGTQAAINADTYTVTISLKSSTNMKWSDGTTTAKSYTWSITKKSLSSATIYSISDKPYTGFAITPTPTVKCGGIILIKGTDFTYSYNNNKNVGSATVTVKATASGNYTGSKSKTFKITPLAMTVSASGYTGVYDGSAHTGTVTVTVPSSGAVVYYGNSANACNSTSPIYRTDAGMQTVYYKVSANNYSDYTGSFTIQISVATISSIPSQKNSLIYTGSPLSPTWNNFDASKMTIGGVTTGTAATDYTATFTPTSNYKWSDNTTETKYVTWKIAKRSLSNATISEVPDRLWTGSQIKPEPEPTVTCNGRTLVKGTDFTFEYENNVDVGAATIRIKAVSSGGYSGSKTATFTIKANTITHSASNYSGTYDGNSHTGSVTVTKPASGATIKYGTTSGSYTSTTPIGKTNAGTYTIYYQVSATGYETATGSFTITIARKSISVPTTTGPYEYTGSPITAQWNGYDSAKMTIGETYSATAANTYTATFTPKSNYKWSDGTTTKKYVSWVIKNSTGTETYELKQYGNDRYGNQMEVTYNITEEWDLALNWSKVKINSIKFTYDFNAPNSHASCASNGSGGLATRVIVSLLGSSGSYDDYTLFTIYHNEDNIVNGKQLQFGGSNTCTFRVNGSNYNSSWMGVSHDSSGNATLKITSLYSWGEDRNQYSGTIYDTANGINTSSTLALKDTKP